MSASLSGVLLIDKPSGPTSHDVVARIRRTSGERSVGHTGTLDPLATGLLPLVMGKATRLASFLSGHAKTYEAGIRLGVATDTDDAEGDAIGERATALPDDDAVDRALAAFRGTFEQLPPAHSAKKVDGKRAYDLARQQKVVELAPVTVTVQALEQVGRNGDLLHVTVQAGAGFYVRALARDLGRALGCGAHLASLRRTRIGPFDVASAVPLDEAERLGQDVGSRLLSPSEALPDLPALVLTPAGLTRCRHGNPVGPEHLDTRAVPPASSGPLRLLDEAGALVAIAHSRGGALHPAVVLG
jgi:tRNA pseudouridine55 synthase